MTCLLIDLSFRFFRFMQLILLMFVSLAGSNTLGANTADTTPVLKVGMNTSWGQPLVFFDPSGTAKKGIIVELVDAILNEAKINYSWVVLPRNRTEEKFLEGEIGLRVFLNPGWTSKPEEHEWSDEVFEEKNVVVQANKQKKLLTTK